MNGFVGAGAFGAVSVRSVSVRELPIIAGNARIAGLITGGGETLGIGFRSPHAISGEKVELIFRRLDLKLKKVQLLLLLYAYYYLSK
ncbi:hypothetical protein [Brucella anthropi]|uniref:hypothetical protein n=1 Tax=Brucella anthropi TaxID=529 RepID=UPI000F6905F8|nr:hypothetical protein [Brucella anthropi]